MDSNPIDPTDPEVLQRQIAELQAKLAASQQASVGGSGAAAQGQKAKAAGTRGVIIDGDNTAPIHTGSGDIHQNIFHQAAQPGASAADLRKGYLAWVSMRANELPLLAGDSGRPVQLSSVYTALMTEGREYAEADPHTAARLARAMAEREPERLSALEALDRSKDLVLMGGPGSGKTTFLNFVALCMAGEMLGNAQNLELLRTPVPADPDNAKSEPKPQRWTHKALLPVRVVLRDFAAGLPPAGAAVGADDLWNFIVKQLPEQLKRYADELQAELLRDGGLILLDGLDEVPDGLQRREQVKQAVQQFAAIYRDCRYLVTSRTYAYQRQDWKLNGFAERELLPFSRGQIERFIDAWYAHMASLFRLTPEDAQARAEVLKRATRRAELRELAERPLLLTLMARLQTKGSGTLPEDRAELYAQSVDMLLDEWEGLKLRRDAAGQPLIAESSLGEWLKASRKDIRRELDKLAYEAHLQQPELVGTADIRQADLIAALMAASKDNVDINPRRLEEYLRDRAGLLTSHGEALYQFPHRSFQEYLAACHLARFKFPDALSELVKLDPNRWREVTLLAAASSKTSPSPTWELVEELCAKDDAPQPGAPAPEATAQWGALLAGQVLMETGLAAPNPNLQERHERKRKRVRDWQLPLLSSAVVPARERALAGDLLAQLGDTRVDLLDVDHMRFAAVPAGPFWMSEDEHKHAKLHRNAGLDYDYWIAQAPITVAQFRQFVTSSGYDKHDRDCLNDPDNRPVVFVSWHDALAFCDWLKRRWQDRLPQGWSVMLPSEAEWEKAARGGERIPETAAFTSAGQGFSLTAPDLRDNPEPQRVYPWGNAETRDLANAAGTVGDTSTPGCFESGRSPYGCEDLAGNVWEWTRSRYAKYPYRIDDGRELSSPNTGDWMVVRGGSWHDYRRYTRCASRLSPRPDLRLDLIGFRVVLRASPVR